MHAVAGGGAGGTGIADGVDAAVGGFDDAQQRLSTPLLAPLAAKLPLRCAEPPALRLAWLLRTAVAPLGPSVVEAPPTAPRHCLARR